MRYDLQGNYLGDVKVASNLGVRNPACFVFTDSLIVSHQLSLLPIQGNEKKSPFLLLDKQGNVIDSIHFSSLSELEDDQSGTFHHIVDLDSFVIFFLLISFFCRRNGETDRTKSI